MLGYFPELEWLEKWIEGFDLLLLFLGINSFIEERRSSQAHLEEFTSEIEDDVNKVEKFQAGDSKAVHDEAVPSSGSI